MSNKILITNGYSDSNKGDFAITLATVRVLKDLYPNSTITLQSVYPKKDKEFDFHNRFMCNEVDDIQQMIVPSPYVSSANNGIFGHFLALLNLFSSLVGLAIYTLGLKNVVKYFSHEQYKSLKTFFDADIIIMKGGQYIYNDQGGLRGALYLIRMLIPLVVRKNQITIMSQSIGPINGRISRAVAQWFLSKAKVINVREKNTFDFLVNELNLDNVDIMPDMAFYFSKNDIKSNKRKYLGVTVVNWYFPGAQDVENARENYANQLASSIVDISAKHNITVKFIPQVTVVHHGESDIDMINRVISKIDGLVDYQFVDNDLDINQMLEEYSTCKMLIGTRLHSCILASCVGTPVLAVRYQGYKTQGIMNDLGFAEMVLDISTLERSEINTLADKVFVNSTSISEKVLSKARELGNMVNEKFKNIL